MRRSIHAIYYPPLCARVLRHSLLPKSPIQCDQQDVCCCLIGTHLEEMVDLFNRQTPCNTGVKQRIQSSTFNQQPCFLHHACIGSTLQRQSKGVALNCRISQQPLLPDLARKILNRLKDMIGRQLIFCHYNYLRCIHAVQAA
jgi:hypothetical protein